MNLNIIKKLIRESRIEDALQQLGQSSNIDTYYKDQIVMLTYRFNSLKSRIVSGTLYINEESIEQARIVQSILLLVDRIDGDQYLDEATKKQIENQIDKWAKAFENVDNNEKNSSIRLREKNRLTNLICRYLTENPSLVYKFNLTNNPAIISAIALKIKISPTIEELALLQQVSKRNLPNFTKGNIVNTLGEFVYSGQLRHGDEITIFETLNLLKANADFPLQKNIERVEVALKYFLGQIKQPQAFPPAEFQNNDSWPESSLFIG